MRSPADLLPELARRHGDRRALVTQARTLTFAELDQLSAVVASALAAEGLVGGERVSLYAENRWEWLVAYHGILRAGLVVNPLNGMLTPPEVAYVSDDCQVAAIIGSASRLQALTAHGTPRTVRTLIAFDDPPPGCQSFDEALGRGLVATGPPPDIDPGALGSIGYTSGTTGHPKGAMQPHRAVLLNAALTATMHGRSAADVMLTALPAPHVYGNAAIHATLLAGGTVVLQERFDAGAALELVERHRVTMIEGVPTMYAALLAHEDAERRDLHTLTRCTVGGQTMPVDVMTAWEQRSGAPLIELWGMTEIAGLGTTHAIHAPRLLGSIGVSLPGVELRVASLDDPTVALGPDEPGELLVRGPIVMLGYWANAEATSAVLDDQGWLRTGDVATVDETGHYFIVDRHKDMLITAGYNVYPAEIERVIAKHPAVSMVAVGKVPDVAKGELACAYIVLRPGREATEQEIVDHCRTQLAAYKVPRSVHFVEDLPKTSTGKILRRKLSVPAQEVSA